MDNEASFKTEWVRDFFASKGILVKYFPVGLGNLMNPCDNNFHSVFKRYFYHLLDGYQSADKSEKISLAVTAYFKVKETSIKHFFEHAGLINSSVSAETIVHSLLSEGIAPKQRFIPIHNQQLNAYIEWRRRSKKDTPDLFSQGPETLYLRRQFV